MLNDLLIKQVAVLHFSIEELQLQIIIPIGKIKRYIYVPIRNDDPEEIRLFLFKYMQLLEQYKKLTMINASNKITQILNQSQKAEEQFQIYHDSLNQKMCLTRSYEKQLKILNEDDLKLNRQILVIDQEIMSCKRGLELEQYRLETSSENREERKKNVYFCQLRKLNNHKIHKIIREDNKSLVRLELGQCELRLMKFVEIFQNVQDIKLPKNSIRKIEGLNSLSHLRRIDLEGNIIEKIQGFNNNMELREIKLQRNRIVRIQNIFHLCRLQTLALSENQIEDIPREIKMLEGLVELRLVNNSINHLPSELLNLNKLRILSITGNPCAKENHKSKDILKKLTSGQVDINSTLI